MRCTMYNTYHHSIFTVIVLLERHKLRCGSRWLTRQSQHVGVWDLSATMYYYYSSSYLWLAGKKLDLITIVWWTDDKRESSKIGFFRITKTFTTLSRQSIELMRLLKLHYLSISWKGLLEYSVCSYAIYLPYFLLLFSTSHALKTIFFFHPTKSARVIITALSLSLANV